MNSLLYAAVIAFCVFAVNGAIFKDCGSKEGKIKSLSITNCESEPQCKLKKGTNVTVAIDFMTSEVVTKVTAVVHGDIHGVEVPFSPPNPDGCKDSGLTCPLKSAMSYSYHTILPIRDYYPSINLLVKWELQDQSGKDIVCMFIPAEIVS